MASEKGHDSDAAIETMQLPAATPPSSVLVTTVKGRHLHLVDDTVPDSRGWSLVVITGAAIGQRIEVGDRPLVIGRSPECGLALQGGGLSRRHCAVWTVDGGLWIRDLASTNGTFVNGARVTTERWLAASDEVGLGDIVLRVLRRESVEDNYHVLMTERAYVDELTGLGNRRRFQDLIEGGVMQALLRRETFSLVLLDLDDFKCINDRYGHDVGDHVLRSCAEQLRCTTRSPGGLARIGGEEFAAILEGADISIAVKYANRCRKAIAAMRFPDIGPEFRLSASFGVASWQSDMADSAALIKVADGRLYAAKRAGKNCVVSD
jgi:diguanylate cyclase (GGDEF)-like protein